MNGERKLALFIDFENIARGVKEAQYKAFEIKLVLERLLEKGKVSVRRAYADWNRFTEYKRPFHEWAIELIDVHQSRYSGKNSADIRMVVDALDLAYGKTHIDSFALVSGDSDFSPLVSKLRENDRYVIGLGVKSSSSDLLVANCDEFIFYEDLIRETKKTNLLRGLPEKKAEAMTQLFDAIQALQRENKETLWGSMVKQTMIRKNPAFNESYYGFSTFSKLLEEAAKQRIVTLERDEKSGTYVITSLVEEGGRAAYRLATGAARLAQGRNQPVDRQAASAADEDRQRHGDQRQVELVAVALALRQRPVQEEAVPRVDLLDRHQHDDDQPERRRARQEPEDHRESAKALDARRRHGGGRRDAHLSEARDGLREPAAAEPTEDLLRAVREENHPQRQPDDQVRPGRARPEHEVHQPGTGSSSPLAMVVKPAYPRRVTRVTRRARRSPRVYYTLARVLSGLVLVAVWAVGAAAQVTLTVAPAMVKGPPDAPVTIVEFSDYQ